MLINHFNVVHVLDANRFTWHANRRLAHDRNHRKNWSRQVAFPPCLALCRLDAQDAMSRVKRALRDADYRVEGGASWRSEEHTSELQSLMRTSYAVFCLKKKKH